MSSLCFDEPATRPAHPQPRTENSQLISSSGAGTTKFSPKTRRTASTQAPSTRSRPELLGRPFDEVTAPGGKAAASNETCFPTASTKSMDRRQEEDRALHPARSSRPPADVRSLSWPSNVWVERALEWVWKTKRRANRSHI